MKHFFNRFILFLTAVTLVSAMYAQDIIVTMDAKKIEAKILEVSKTEIKYKENDNVDGPTFVLSVEDINSVIYSNGKVVFYNQQTSTAVNSNSRSEKDDVDKAGLIAQERIAQQQELEHRQMHERKIQEEQQREREQFERSQAQLQESMNNLNKAINQYVQSDNTYILEVHNTSKSPYRVNLDGHILGVVNAYKVERYLVSIDWYGRLQVVQTQGYMFSPTVKDYKITRQQKHATVIIKI